MSLQGHADFLLLLLTCLNILIWLFSIPYEEIDPINGFKWDNEWKVVIDESTDPDGYFS